MPTYYLSGLLGRNSLVENSIKIMFGVRKKIYTYLYTRTIFSSFPLPLVPHTCRGRRRGEGCLDAIGRGDCVDAARKTANAYRTCLVRTCPRRRRRRHRVCDTRANGDEKRLIAQLCAVSISGTYSAERRRRREYLRNTKSSEKKKNKIVVFCFKF